ncbi:acyl-CoA dehydrogenase family protein [Mycobacterium sp. E796]|uniref:acyl-CoA dehydrogenase family protein n=1 Tax=Mycobacterium sp. E796 TaxID=1834151 RepID=UPI0008013514|nr:acyl-CoA dehydrogenase family protein [Mycobacterium sp. E796]OBI67224.1 acyl-CoA dehydrogenase [Mycobacterium sp. E796]
MTHDGLSSLSDIAASAKELARLRASADDILRRAWSSQAFRALLDGPGAVFDPKLWQTITDAGWADVLVSEAGGGGGGGLRELCVLAEAAGAASAPVPLAGAAAAGWCEDRCADGVSLLLLERGEHTGAGVSGVWPLVPYGAVATRLLVCAGTGEATILGAVEPTAPGVLCEPVTPLDHNPAARITLHETHIDAFESGECAGRRHRQAGLRSSLAQVAELVGIASAANDAATEYAKLRVAFGRPIGAFQAIKHRLVDQRCAIEVGRALVNRAADACQHEHPDAAALVSLAVYWGIDALRAVPEGATQVFGGIAYTWEHDAHIYLRRAASAAANLGARAYHRDVATRWLTARYPATETAGDVT